MQNTQPNTTNNFLQNLTIINNTDTRQQGKIKHQLNHIVALALFATIGNANNFVEIQHFAEEHQQTLQTLIPLKNGIPSHDTIQRAFTIIDKKYFDNLLHDFNEMLNNNEGEKIRKLFSIDGKTQNGTQTKDQKPNHIVSIINEHGFCIGGKLVGEKTNEITAIPVLLNSFNIKDSIITMDAMGTQRAIAALIRKRGAHYVLALKANQGYLYEEVVLFFADPDFLAKCAYYKTEERARGGVETREYWQGSGLGWLPMRGDWMGLRSIVMVRRTTVKEGITSVEVRYFISSLPLGVVEVALAIRGHWRVESFHWFLDVVFREDSCRVLDRHVSYNLNVLRKLALNFLRLLDVGRVGVVSLRQRRFIVCCNPVKYLEQILAV